jgi:hypothetical protein
LTIAASKQLRTNLALPKDSVAHLRGDAHAHGRDHVGARL